jgi:hypothetical protein
MSQLDMDSQTVTALAGGRTPTAGDPERTALLAADSLPAQSQQLREAAGCLAVAALALGGRPAAGDAPGAAGPAAGDAMAWAAGHPEAVRTGTRVALPLAGGGSPVLA